MLVRWIPVTSLCVITLGASGFAAAASCPATTFCRSDTVTNTGTLSSPNAVVATTGYADNGTPVAIGTSASFSFGDAFGAGQTGVGSHFNTSQTVQSAPSSTAPDSGWNFYDDYRFTINPGSSLDTAVISVNAPSGAQVSNLEVRLFTAGQNGAAPNGPPTLGSPTGGTIVDKWSTTFPGGSYLYTLPTGFAAGSYDLQIRGLAVGASSYGGNINFQPVPLPAGLPLLVSALGALGIARRRLDPARI